MTVNIKYNEAIALVADKVQVIAVTDKTKQTIAEEVNVFIRALKNLISDADMASGRISVLEALSGVNNAPTADTILINGTAIQGSTLVGSYAYFDINNDIEGATTFRWLRNGVAIVGATSKSYIIAALDVGATIIFEVTPKAVTGTLVGAAYRSSGLLIPDPALNITPTSLPLMVSSTMAGFTTKGTVDGLETGDVVSRIWLAYGIAGTTYAQAIAANRFKILSAGADLAAYQVAGYSYAATLVAGTSYVIWAKVEETMANGGANLGAETSSAVFFITHQAPTIPNVSAVAVDSSATVSLVAASTLSDGATLTGYNIYNGATKLNTTPTTLPYTQNSLTNGTTYNYQVESVDSFGAISAKSAVISVTPNVVLMARHIRWEVIDGLGSPDMLRIVEIEVNNPDILPTAAASWTCSSAYDLPYGVPANVADGVLDFAATTGVGGAFVFGANQVTNQFIQCDLGSSKAVTDWREDMALNQTQQPKTVKVYIATSAVAPAKTTGVNNANWHLASSVVLSTATNGWTTRFPLT